MVLQKLFYSLSESLIMKMREATPHVGFVHISSQGANTRDQTDIPKARIRRTLPFGMVLLCEDAGSKITTLRVHIQSRGASSYRRDALVEQQPSMLRRRICR
jgi:hypothetical protein